MHLFILRHGIAEDLKRGQSDSDRPLTGEGRRKLTAVLTRASQAGMVPSLILTSPYLRTMQTAHIAAELLGREIPVLSTPVLVPHGSPLGVWQLVSEHRTEDSLLLTGHEPLLSQVVSYLLASPALRFDFKKGALVAITLESFRGEPHGTLEWILTAKLAGE